MINLSGMMGGTPSVADIAAVTDGNRNNGFGDNNAWWVIILILALCGGFGNWGNGGFGGNGGGTVAVDAAVQRGFDTQTIVSKLDGLNSGICSLGYDQLAQMNNITTAILQGNFGLQTAINNNTVANMQNTNALSTQISDCCCKNQTAFQDLKYTMATDTCAITNALNQAAQNIMLNDDRHFNALHEEMMQDRLAAKDAQINALTAQLNVCSRDTALQGLGSWIVSQVNPRPVPAWNVPNPNVGTNCLCNCG